MRDHEEGRLSRRDFLETGAAATTAGLAASSAMAAPGVAKETESKTKVLPRRALGKTGVKVTILNQGTWRSPDSLDRLLRLGYSQGIRYIDTAGSYGSEPGIAKWFAAMPAGTRKEIFLVTKEGHAQRPRDLLRLVDQRLDALKTDYINLLFIHGIGGEERLSWPKSKELADTIDALKKSGKARLVGFSCHDRLKVEYLNAAAEGGIVDAIMVAYTPPWLDKEHRMNRALDACHKKGIGLISMKQIAGNNPERILKEIPKHLPELAEKGLTPYQMLLHSIWTDERFASCCVSMRDTDKLRENIQAARNFKPLNQAQMSRLRDALLAVGPTFCANCDGSCSRAAGTDADLGDLTRLLTYHDHYGFRGEARRLYSELDEKARDWSGADLEAARQACPSKLDFASLLPKVERDLA
jgi:predicted aldo/keto reductase-like oxidoreductase